MPDDLGKHIIDLNKGRVQLGYDAAFSGERHLSFPPYLGLHLERQFSNSLRVKRILFMGLLSLSRKTV